MLNTNYLKLSENKDLERIGELLQKQSVVMMSISEPGEGIQSQPMQIVEIDESYSLWFLIEDSCHLAQSLRGNNEIGISVEDSDEQKYLSITGHGYLNRDRDKKNQLWRNEFHEWFDKGIDADKICCLEVKPRSAHLWERESGIERFIHTLTTKVTGVDHRKDVDRVVNF